MTKVYSATFSWFFCLVLRKRWIRNIPCPPSLHLFLCWYILLKLFVDIYYYICYIILYIYYLLIYILLKLLITAFSLPSLPPNEVLLSKEMHLYGEAHILCIFNKASVLEPHRGATVHAKYKSSALIWLSYKWNTFFSRCVAYEHIFAFNVATKRNLSKIKSTVFLIVVLIIHNAMRI